MRVDYWDRQTYPWLAVHLILTPWSWRFVPAGWWDYTPRDEDRHGGLSVDAEWLALKVEFGCNFPLFRIEDPS